MELQIQISRLSLLVIILLLFLQSQKSGAIKCFECSSDYDPFCEDPFTNSTILFTDCTDKAKPLESLSDVESNLCRKIRYKLHGEWKIQRSCAFLGEPDKLEGDKRPCLTRTSVNNIFMEICTCDSDGCNSTAKLTVSPLMIFFNLLAASGILINFTQ